VVLTVIVTLVTAQVLRRKRSRWRHAVGFIPTGWKTRTGPRRRWSR